MYLTGKLLDLNEDELGRFEGGKSNQDVHDAQVDVVLRGRLVIALDKVGIAWCLALEGSLAEEVVHERADVEAYLRPERLVVRLEDNPFCAAIEAFFNEEGRAAHRNVLVIICEGI